MINFRNHVLKDIPADERAALGVRLRLVGLRRGEVLYEPGSVVRTVFFPETCTLSLVHAFDDGESVESATVGCEGFACLRLLLSQGERAAARHVVGIGGEAWTLRRQEFRRLAEELPAFRNVAMRFVSGFIDIAVLSIACNRAHRVEQRLARWLLMMRDRSVGDDMPLTHEMLAEMLGIERPTVSRAMKELREQGVVAGGPSRILIRDRRGLEARACECYRIGTRMLPAGCSA